MSVRIYDFGEIRVKKNSLIKAFSALQRNVVNISCDLHRFFTLQSLGESAADKVPTINYRR